MDNIWNAFMRTGNIGLYVLYSQYRELTKGKLESEYELPESSRDSD